MQFMTNHPATVVYQLGDMPANMPKGVKRERREAKLKNGKEDRLSKKPKEDTE